MIENNNNNNKNDNFVGHMLDYKLSIFWLYYQNSSYYFPIFSVLNNGFLLYFTSKLKTKPSSKTINSRYSYKVLLILRKTTEQSYYY